MPRTRFPAGVTTRGNLAAPVVPSQQKLEKLMVTTLKNLKDVDLDFTQSPLTAIMGANCSGKTTVLHALACVFSPPDENAPNYKFPQFFKPNTDSLWSGSDFTILYSQRQGTVLQTSLPQQYTKAQDRWTPRYERRPTRFTRFLMIKDSVPEVEMINVNAMIHYQRTGLTGQSDNMIREAAGQILNRTYDQFHRVSYRHWARKSIGVSVGELTYPALSMSSGEQRVFQILEAVFNAPNYALILIDEIDLFLHQDALQRLLGVLVEHCRDKNKQLVFTTHFPPVANMYEQISVLTLHRAPVRTYVWSGYSHAALRHITGTQEKPISVFAEDDVAAEIIAQVSRELRIRPFTHIGHYGPAVNAFALGAGIVLSGISLENTLIVLDGDVLTTRSERSDRAKKVLTGNGDSHERQRKSLLAMIKPLWSVVNKSPEQMLHLFLRQLNNNGLNGEELDLLEIAHGVVNVPERHGFVGKIIELTGESREVALSKIVPLAAKAPGWIKYTRLVRFWLKSRREQLNLIQRH
jgi:ABC-type lipoprotein export system ATPase subunit